MDEETYTETETEVTAREHGWVPEGEFKGDKTNWVDADTWESRSKTERIQADKIKKQDEQFEALSGVLERMKAQDKTRDERAKTEALKEFKATAKEALAEGDEAKLETAIDGYEKQAEEPDPYTSPADFAYLNTWLGKHPEYKRQDVMQSAAFEAKLIIQKTPGLPIETVYDMVHEEMTKIYPEHFGNKAREKPAAVEGEGQRLAPKKATMEPEFKKAMESYGTKMAKSSAYKGKSGKTGTEGFDADKQLAMDDYKRSYDMEDAL